MTALTERSEVNAEFFVLWHNVLCQSPPTQAWNKHYTLYNRPQTLRFRYWATLGRNEHPCVRRNLLSAPRTSTEHTINKHSFTL